MTTWRDEVRAHIDTWSKRLRDRQFWPKFVYHFTDLRNALSILQAGRLHSREDALRLGLVRIDSASPDIIAHTAQAHVWEDKVRTDYQALFERRWVYVETVTTIDADIEFRFNQDASAYGPFDARFVYEESGGGKRIWRDQASAVPRLQRFSLEGARRGVATLTLDGHTAFAGPVTFDDTPF
ncbi:MAG: DarT ssDNA thymidine ADP-ribosyltransferase family protein [Polyangiaceae bacterium]